MGTEKDLKIEDELTWIYDNPSLQQNSSMKNKLSYLPAIGCVVTTGVLAKGIYHFRKGDSKKQQMSMRQRVLAQGITIGFTLACVFLSPILQERFSRWG